MAGSFQIPVSVSVRGLLLAAALIRVDHHKGVKVETPSKDQGVIINNIQVITMQGETAKDQIVILICEDLIEVQKFNGLQEYLQVIVI